MKSILTTSRNLTTSEAIKLNAPCTDRRSLLLVSLVAAATLTGCSTAAKYPGVAPTLVEQCKREAREILRTRVRNDDSPISRDVSPNDSAQSALFEARLGRDESASAVLGGATEWPEDVLIDRCLVENDVAISPEAAAELSRWMNGVAPGKKN